MEILSSLILQPQFWIVIIPIILILATIAIWGNVKIDLTKKLFNFGSSKTRSCEDCIMLMLAKRTEFEKSYNKLLDSILRQQMNYLETKIIEIEKVLNIKNETLIKDVFRSAFKQNGIENLTEQEFATYIRVKQEKISLLLECDTMDLADIVKDVYIYARDVATSTYKKLEILEKSFMDDIYSLVKDRQV